jgi:hypothetical protein
MGGPDYTRTERPRRWRARKKRGYKIIRIRVTPADEIKLTALGYCQGVSLQLQRDFGRQVFSHNSALVPTGSLCSPTSHASGGGKAWSNHAPIAALTFGSTCSASKIIERFASAGSSQSLPA